MTTFTPHEIADESLRNDEARVCARCDAVIDTREWHPTIALGDPVDVFLFCSEECADAWDEETPADETAPEN